MNRRPTLGTLLRSLLDHLDAAVEAAYRDAGLDYRPRYTPIVRALVATPELTIRALSRAVGVSHSAMSQTVSEMARRGLVERSPGATDAREKVIRLTAMGRELLPALERQWAATNAAADALDRELSMPLSTLLAETLAALEREPYAARIASEAARRTTKGVTA